MSLDEKLRKIDHSFMDKLEIERVAPYKSLEEKMVKYKKEVDMKY